MDLKDYQSSFGVDALMSICVQKYSLDHLKIADFASSLNGRLCSDQLNYIY